MEIFEIRNVIFFVLLNSANETFFQMILMTENIYCLAQHNTDTCKISSPLFFLFLPPAYSHIVHIK